MRGRICTGRRLPAGHDLLTVRLQAIQREAAEYRTFDAAYQDFDHLTDRWSLWLDYERQTTHPGTSDVITRNSIVTLALRWDY